MKKLLLITAALTAVAAFAETKKPEAAAKPADAKTAFKITGDATKGMATFKTYCSSCHGETGKGDGAAAVALNPKPANLADAKRAAEVTDEYVFNMIKEGGAANGKSPMMAAWKGSLKDPQIHDVAAYVRSLSKGAAAPAPAAPEKKDEKKPAAKK